MMIVGELRAQPAAFACLHVSKQDLEVRAGLKLP